MVMVIVIDFVIDFVTVVIGVTVRLLCTCGV